MSLYIGVDEAGRGALAGPIVVVAVILSNKFNNVRQLKDSKVLSPTKRELIYESLVKDPNVLLSIFTVSAQQVDEMNVLQATLFGMQQSVLNLKTNVKSVLIDGNKAPKLSGYKVKTVIGGDRTVSVISAASIIAKVTRDRFMEQLDKVYPGYRFNQHKGYGTSSHYDCLMKSGPSPIHRLSFNLNKQLTLFNAK